MLHVKAQRTTMRKRALAFTRHASWHATATSVLAAACARMRIAATKLPCRPVTALPMRVGLCRGGPAISTMRARLVKPRPSSVNVAPGFTRAGLAISAGPCGAGLAGAVAALAASAAAQARSSEMRAIVRRAPQPPATAGRIVTSSPSATGVSRPSRKRMSSPPM